jgi:hypothetical protein
METRKWEEELAGRWCEIAALVAGGTGAQAEEESNRHSVIGEQKELRAKDKGPRKKQTLRT